MEPRTLSLFSDTSALKAALLGLPRDTLEGYRSATDEELNLFFTEAGFKAVFLPRLRALFRAEMPSVAGTTFHLLAYERDVSHETWAALGSMFPDAFLVDRLYQTPRTAEELASWLGTLRALLQSPLVVPIPSHERKPPYPLCQPARGLFVFRPGAIAAHPELEYFLSKPVPPHQRLAKSEDDTRSLVDSVVVRTLCLLGQAAGGVVEHSRNTADCLSVLSDMPSYRFDNNFWFRHSLLLVGEEKKVVAAEAIDDLFDRLSFKPEGLWGGLWFRFAYVSEPTGFQLVVAVSTSEVPRDVVPGPPGMEHAPTIPAPAVRLFALSGLLSWSTPEGITGILVATINLFRVLMTMTPNLPRWHAAIGKEYVHGQSTVIVTTHGSTDLLVVRKRFMVDQERWMQLKRLYDGLNRCKSLNIARVIACAGPSDAQFHRSLIEVAPVGVPVEPRGEDEVRAMTTDVLKALSLMHELSYGHCDVRRPNVVRLHDGSWCLIDLECALPFGNPIDYLVTADVVRACRLPTVSSVAADLAMLSAIIPVGGLSQAGLEVCAALASGHFTAQRVLQFEWFNN
eukprot:m51a1_g3671 hypothetical protein (568) ;mRNA; r:273107-275218